MTLHMLKLSVGSESFEDMTGYQTRRLEEARRAGRLEVVTHHTRMMPRRRVQVLDGGSIYWVIKGVILCRNPVADLVPLVDEEGRRFCQIRYGPELVRVDPRPCRIFQGWRYLEAADAPRDLEPGEIDEAMPPRMAAELRALGLI